jgi:hypothetical protein
MPSEEQSRFQNLTFSDAPYCRYITWRFAMNRFMILRLHRKMTMAACRSGLLLFLEGKPVMSTHEGAG